MRAQLAGPRLWLGDRQFCDLTQPAVFAVDSDHYVVRYHPKTPFYPDPACPPQQGTDAQGWAWQEAWGWLGSPRNAKRRYVRMISLARPAAEAICLVTDLLDAAAYPAADLLALYRLRWGIEEVFQQITEVFHLQALIGTTPQGTVFQLAFCLLLYNLLQVVRGYVAVAQARPIPTISLEKELTKGVLKAVAQERARFSQSKPQLKRGRPAANDQEARRRARKSKAIHQKISDLFQDRYLFVKRRLKGSERKRLLHITRGLPHLRKLREIMDHLYALFDRRCRTQTAIAKLKKLRQWVTRFQWIGETLKKVFSPNLEKALTFLDDKLLPSTSNAVERGNRRYRKMQKSIYSVRTQQQITARIALDMWREAQGAGRDQTLQTLHEARAG